MTHKGLKIRTGVVALFREFLDKQAFPFKSLILHRTYKDLKCQEQLKQLEDRQHVIFKHGFLHAVTVTLGINSKRMICQEKTEDSPLCVCAFYSLFCVGNKTKERQRPAERACLRAAPAEEDRENDQREHGRARQPAQKHLVEPVDTQGGVGRPPAHLYIVRFFCIKRRH